MSITRPILKGVTLMLTRRVHGRVFRLRPCKRTNQIVGFVLAVMQARWKIRIHAVDVLSNHWHVVLSDPFGHIVKFQHDCHEAIARAVDTTFGDFDSLWASSEQSSRAECQEPHDVVKKIAYTMANPVEARLVRYGSSWPGLRRAWPSKPMVFKKPAKFFRGKDQGGKWPMEAVLELSRPPGYEELDDDELAALISGAIEEREEKFRRQHDSQRKPFLGRREIRKQSRYGHPHSREQRFGMSPKVVCRNKWARIERLNRDKDWLTAYYASMERWRGGDRDVVFPAGTYLMREVHNVNCAPPPD